jgi:hypothetical protein
MKQMRHQNLINAFGGESQARMRYPTSPSSCTGGFSDASHAPLVKYTSHFTGFQRGAFSAPASELIKSNRKEPFYGYET